MGKLLVTLITTLSLLFIVYLMVGPRLNSTIFHTSWFSPTYLLVVGGVMFFGVWRIVKGK